MVNEQSAFAPFLETLKAEPVFVILGSQGSGTNLLSRLMQSVFSFSVVHDRSLIFGAAANVQRNLVDSTIRRELNRVYNSLFPGPLRKRFLGKRYFNQAKHYKGIEQYLHNVTIKSSEDFANFFYCYHTFVDQAQHKAIKSDDLWELIEMLPSVLPRRRYILLVRDPRDNALSIVNKPFGPCEIYSASKYVQRRLHIYRTEMEQHPNDSVTIRYEDILEAPMVACEQLATFLGVTLPSDAKSTVEELNIRRQNHDKWRKLPTRDLEASEAVLADDCRYYGYELSAESPRIIGTPETVIRKSRDIARRIPQKVKRRIRDWITP